MINRTALSCTLASTLAASALLGAPAAQAAPKNETLYVHGGSSMALFGTRADCNAHAAGWLPRLAKDKNKRLVPALADSNEVGPEQRASCFPLRSGKWTYLVAYFSTDGMLTKYDKAINIPQRLRNPETPQIDTESVWAYTHEVAKPSKTWPAASCSASASNMIAKVRANSHTRLVAGFGCIVRFGARTYATYYLGDSARAGLYGDRPEAEVNKVPMLDVLGYNYLINTPVTPPSARAVQPLAQH